MNKLAKLAGKKAGGNVGRSMLAASMSVAAIAASVTGAVFTDSDAVGANTLATGNIELTTNPATNVVSMSNMAPGDVQLGSVTVNNGGSLQLRYALTSVATQDVDLAAQLDLTVWAEASETTADGACGTPPTTPLHAGDLGSAAGVAIFGNPAQGSQTGDRVVAAGSSELLCLKVVLPTTTTSTFESKTTTATFTFDSEQTVNNA